ncbi:hypothetical protein PaG_00847 [Moesziomyces aphidis]|uniref:RRM domain-containing protein n=1 Tax=Moesziomyces aphidis TaxID=84754 RepID=W3VTR5_MOEAP|nr:hypothetical protein PaG_00847 [Moesziomyces aphidis]
MAPTLRTRAAAAVSASSDRPPSPRKPAPLGRVVPANGNPSPLSTHPPSFTSITPSAHSSGWHLASVLFRSAIGAALVTLLFSVTTSPSFSASLRSHHRPHQLSSRKRQSPRTPLARIMSANPASDASDAASATPSHSVSSPFSPHAAAFGPSTPLNLGASNRLHGLSSDGHSLSSRASSFASSHGRALSPAAKAASPFANAENSHTSAAFYGFGDRLRDATDHSRQSSGGAHNNLSATSPATPSLLSGSAASRCAPSPSPRSLAAGADSTYPSTDFLGQSQSSLPDARSPNSLVPPSAASDLQRRFSSSFGAQGDAASPTLLDAPTNGARPPFGRQSFSDGPAASDHQHSAEITSALMESHHSSSSGGFPTATHPANLHNLSDPASLRPDPSLPLPAAAPTPTTGPLSASDPRTQLLVSNLPYRVRWQDLKDLFRKAGTVLRADVSLSADNRSRGYGTVLMATEQDAIKAADMLGGFTWQGRTLDVRVDRSGTLVGVAGSAAMPTIAPNNLRANANAMPAMLGNYANGHSPMAHALDQSANQPFLGIPSGSFSGGASPSALSPLARAAAADASQPMSTRSSFSAHNSNAQPTEFERAMLHGASNGGAARHGAPYDHNFAGAAQHRAVSSLQSMAASRRGSEVGLGMGTSPSSGGWPAGSNDASGGMLAQNAGGSSVPTGFPGATAMAPWPAGPAALAGNAVASMQSQPFAPHVPTTSYAGRVLFVGNLPFHCQWQDLKDLFRAAGNIQRADVAIGPDGRSRGFGTVLFASQEDAQNAVRLYHGYEYSGRTLKVHFDRFAAQNGPAIGTPGNPAQYTGAFAAAALPSHMTNNVRAPSIPAPPLHGMQTSYAQNAMIQHQQQQRAGAASGFSQYPAQGAFGGYHPADASARAFAQQQSSLLYPQQQAQQAPQQQYGQQLQQQQHRASFSGFADAGNDAASSSMSAFGADDLASAERQSNTRQFGLFSQASEAEADKGEGRDEDYGMTISMPASGFGAASSYLPSDLMSPGLVSPPAMAQGNAHPGRIQLPTTQFGSFGGGAEGNRSDGRMQVPMTPGMPGFTFNPVPETPPLYPQFLSPGLGPFSPTVGGSSHADVQAGQMQGANMAAFMNAAPGAPVHAHMGGASGYNPMFPSAYAGTYAGQQQPATPHWSQTAGPRRFIAERGSTVAHEADEVVDDARAGIAKTPGAGPRRPSHVAMDHRGTDEAKRRASDGTPGAEMDGYPFPMVASGAMGRRASTNSAAGTPLGAPGRTEVPVQAELGGSAEELANTIARLSVKGTALAKESSRRSVSMTAERSAASAAMAKLRGKAEALPQDDEAKLGAPFADADAGPTATAEEAYERLLGLKVSNSALEQARNGSALDTGSEAGESRKSTPRDEAGPTAK